MEKPDKLGNEDYLITEMEIARENITSFQNETIKILANIDRTIRNLEEEKRRRVKVCQK